jgi:hypothetical protein
MDISQLTDTEQLYWSACEQWVKSHGGLPKVNELYNQVGKGSLTTVVKVRRLYLAQLAAAAAPSIDVDGLPDSLRLQAQGLLAKLWTQACREADARWAQVEVQLRDQLQACLETEQRLQGQLAQSEAVLQEREKALVELTQTLEAERREASVRASRDESRLHAAYAALQEQAQRAAKERDGLSRQIIVLQEALDKHRSDEDARRKEYLRQLDAVRQELRLEQEKSAAERHKNEALVAELHLKEIELVRAQQRLHLLQRQLQEQRAQEPSKVRRPWKQRR